MSKNQTVLNDNLITICIFLDATPQSGLKPHKPVARSSSSNPRLESGPPPSPIPEKRPQSASICAASIPQEEHPSRIFQKNPNLHKTSAATKQQSGATPTPAKKPLTRLLKSPPGQLVPPNPPSPNPSEQEHNPNSSGFRQAFYRGLSIDPRRGSTSSTAPMDNNNISSKDHLRRNSSAFFHSRFTNHHQPLSQMNSNSSSNYDRHSNVSGGRSEKGPSEPLPWCGCWGNGCI